MDDINKQILELVNTRGKSAPQMTHALKFIGDGNMENGIEKIKTYFVSEGKKIGEMTGYVKGVVFTSLVFTVAILIKEKIETDKKRKEEGQAILMGLEASLTNEGANLKENLGMKE